MQDNINPTSETIQSPIQEVTPVDSLSPKTFSLAEPIERTVAHIIDVVIYFVTTVFTILLLWLIYIFIFFGDLRTSPELLFGKESSIMGFTTVIFIYSFHFFIPFLYMCIYYLFIPLKVWNGQTIGKRLMKIKIIYTNGTNIDLAGIIKRLILTFSVAIIVNFPYVGICCSCLVFFIPVINLIMLFSDPRRQSLHDKIANTIVVNA